MSDADLRQLFEKMGAVGARVDVCLDEVTALRGEVKALREDRDRGRGWISGVLAVLALLGTVAGWVLRLTPLALLLGGCMDTGPVGADAYWHEAQRPVHVYVHAELRPACAEAVIAARDLWRDRCGVDWLRLHSVTDGWAGWYGPRAPAGTISVRDATLPLAILGNTETMHVARRLRWARVRLALDDREAEVCSVFVVAHELGHALGLEDRYDDADSDLLMYWQDTGSTEITDAECAWVNQ